MLRIGARQHHGSVWVYGETNCCTVRRHCCALVSISADGITGAPFRHGRGLNHEVFSADGIKHVELFTQELAHSEVTRECSKPTPSLASPKLRQLSQHPWRTIARGPLREGLSSFRKKKQRVSFFFANVRSRHEFRGGNSTGHDRLNARLWRRHTHLPIVYAAHMDHQEHNRKCYKPRVMNTRQQNESSACRCMLAHGAGIAPMWSAGSLKVEKVLSGAVLTHTQYYTPIIIYKEIEREYIYIYIY